VTPRTTLSVSAAHIATVRGFLPPKGMTSIADVPTKPKEAAALHAALDALAARIDGLETALRQIACMDDPSADRNDDLIYGAQATRIARAALADAKETEA
jgi:hypothetical protein